MKKFLVVLNFIIVIFAYLKNKQIKDEYQINLNDIESEEDVLDLHGMYKDSDGNIHFKEEVYE
ncbi:hypothetical protein HMPREF2953_10585 [Staphylococcus sp. HMSC072E01]|uniref:hypothetical protein n=1 Tax=Staphylococcus sp. HMSC072E01 TaxID=1739457 RepID=UPI0008A53236|nr:hypothetical protein [Staphylococcus sp. HMSC072E01]OFQ09608.1 hypothetical protein HMPREF2953_10585 [Staphylococcus sp. HMSC072E01]